MKDAVEPLLSLDEAAQYLKVSKTSLRRWTNEGRLPCVRVGRRGERRFRLSDMKRFLEPSAAASPAPARHGHAQAHAREPREVLDEAAGHGVERHVCLFYRNRDEDWRLFRHYVLEHLQQGAPLIFIPEDGQRPAVLSRLAEEGFDPAELKRKHLLKLLTPRESYFRTGVFSGQRMVDFVEATILDHRALGFSRMLISGDMSWYLSGAEGVDQMIPYETALNGMMRRYPDVTIVCHYDVMRLPGEIHLGALCSHPHAHLPDRMALGYYRPTA